MISPQKKVLYHIVKNPGGSFNIPAGPIDETVLLVTGGHVSNKQSDTIELVGLNGTEVISDLKLPKPSVDHCQIYWNETTWLFVGVADETYFVNFEEKKYFQQLMRNAQQ